MSTILNIKDHNTEARLFFHRTVWMLILIALLIIIIISRQIQLQIYDYAQFETKSKTNYLKIEPDPPIRGLIYDRNRTLLVDNRPSFNLEIIPERVPCNPKQKRKTCITQLLLRLRRLVTIEEPDLRFFWKTFRDNRYRHFFSVPIRRNLEDHEVAIIAARRHRLKGVDIVQQLSRYYIYPNSLAHVIGYVRRPGRATQKKWTDEQKENYKGTSHVGVKGIEKQYESLLHGKVGKQQVERNVHGRRIDESMVKASIPGKNIYLTIDVRLQNLAEKLLGDNAGSVVALDPNNGEVLALVSKPGYDPNEFVEGISVKKYRKLQNDRKRPLNPRAIVGAYPPGSTIKPFYGLAGLHYATIHPDHNITCLGKFYLPGVSRPWRDWKKGGHGQVNLQKSIMRSCDVYYYRLAVKLRINKITEFLGMFGFGSKTGIDMPHEKAGVLPSRAWKYKRFKHLLKKRPAVTKWFTGDTVSVGIGQGYITATPLQLALAVATIANRGKMMQPRLLYAEETSGSKELLYTQPKIKRILSTIKLEHWKHIVDDMISVVHTKWAGTAWRTAEITAGEYQVGGKTGTAQVVKQTAESIKRRLSEIPLYQRDHALFISFAPADKPKIAVAILCEHCGHGSTGAAPIAAKLIRSYMNILNNKPLDWMPPKKSKKAKKSKKIKKVTPKTNQESKINKSKKNINKKNINKKNEKKKNTDKTKLKTNKKNTQTVKTKHNNNTKQKVSTEKARKLVPKENTT